MQVIANILSESGIEPKAALLLAFLLIFVPALPYLRRRIIDGASPQLRPIPGFKALQQMTGQSMETGRPLHLSVGIQGVGNQNAAQTLAGLTTLEYLARETAVYGAPPIVTVADPTAFIVGQDVIRRAFEGRSKTGRFARDAVRIIAPDPVAYASGVMGILSREDVLANIMIGAFSAEYLLIGETGVRMGIHQVVGTGNPQALPFMLATADEVLIGEEMFAGGAYLAKLPTHIASLLIQDWMRLLIVLIIIAGIIWNTVF